MSLLPEIHVPRPTSASSSSAALASVSPARPGTSSPCTSMAERGAPPRVPAGRRRGLGLVRSFTSPLLPDDYLELVNPLWSTRELRGRIERIERETPSAVTVTIKPGWEWEGHRPGQYLRLGIEVDGVHHWRAYSLTSDAKARRRMHLDHAEAGRRRQGLALPVRARASGDDRATRRRGRHLRAARAPARSPAVHQRRQRHHADHEHVAEPCRRRSDRGRGSRALRPLRPTG